MPFAIGLLCLLAAACALSSLVTQGQSYDWYAQTYGERTAAVILALHADDAYHSVWFIAISGFLCLNLLLCSLTRLPGLIRRVRAGRDPLSLSAGEATARVSGLRDPEAFFLRLGLRRIRKGQDPEGRELLAAARNAAGYAGPWICHLGVLLLIAGFALGQMTKQESAVWGLPGQTRMIEGTSLSVTIDGFQAARGAAGQVSQYTTAFTVTDLSDGRRESASAAVNAPASLFGRRFYQNSTGWGADVRVLKDGKPCQLEPLCVGEGLEIRDKEGLTVLLRGFYPDYQPGAGGIPGTASEEIRNPAYLYMAVYQDRVLGMNVLTAGEELTIDEYTVTFENPRLYTLLAVKQDRFTLLALLGGAVTLAGLGLALYFRPEKLQAVREPDGSWTAAGWCRKGGALYEERFLAAAKEDTKEVHPE